MTTVNNDVDAVLAEPQQVMLSSGLPINVLRIRTRATMSLLKILTRGAGEALATIRIGGDVSQEEFTGQLLGAVVLSIPEAEDETIEFINRVVEPANLRTGSRLTAGDREWNEDQEALLAAELDDPDLDDLVTIISEIVKTEAPHIMALGKRLAALFPTALKVEEQKKDQPQKPSSKRKTSSTKSSEG